MDNIINRIINDIKFGELLKAFVEAHWIGKKKDLAESLDIPQARLSKIFGYKDLNTKYIREICNAMGLPEAAFFRFAANHKPKELEHSE